VGRLEMQKAMPLDRRPTPPWWCSVLDGLIHVKHLFVLFLCSKCYGMVDKREFCFFLLIVAYNVVAQRQKTKVVLKSTVELYGVYDTVEMYKKQIKI
jgi:hypothetical protein